MDQLGGAAAQNLYSLAHPEFYETLEHYPIAPQYADRLRMLLPRGWHFLRADLWLHAAPEDNEAARLPIQGFKIHVTATTAHALRVLDLIVPRCVERGLSFKIAGDASLLEYLNSKQQGRGQSGKFMTIYPPDDDTFTGFIEDLYQTTRSEDVRGPYILSDRRYKDSPLLFYRYGGFRPRHRLNADGTRSWFLLSPAGEYVPDRRVPWFQLPPWASDPFADSAAIAASSETVLDGRFAIEGALTFSNVGGVYSAIDRETGRSVVIKEARPLTNCWTAGGESWDAVDLLRREYAILRRLEGLTFVPEPVSFFQEWEHAFLVEARVPGHSLASWWAEEDVILAPYIHRPGRIESFLPKFLRVADMLIAMVEQVHGRGVLIGDLSPRNLLIDPETLQLSLIDFESSVTKDDSAAMLAYAARWGTPGFTSAARRARGTLLPEDDFHAAGMILYNGVVPINYFFPLHRTAEREFLRKFIDLGLPREVETLIAALLRGDVACARSALAECRTQLHNG